MNVFFNTALRLLDCVVWHVNRNERICLVMMYVFGNLALCLLDCIVRDRCKWMNVQSYIHVCVSVET